MTIQTQFKILNTKNHYKYLKENSNWIKELNRSDNNISNFLEYTKEKYSLRITDKVSDFVDNIDMIQKVLSVLK